MLFRSNLLGDFALTLDDAVMQTRFMQQDVDGVNGHWPKFNLSDPTPVAGEFEVNYLNYYKRWRQPGAVFNPNSATGNDKNGLQYFIHTYLTKSISDSRAIVQLPSDDLQDPTVQEISYLDMIRLVSLDYHAARILGLEIGRAHV